MMDALVLRTELTVTAGCADAFRTLSHRWVASTRDEAGTLGYHVYFDEDAGRAIFLEHYADSPAFLRHAEAVDTDLRQALYGTCSMQSLEVYGDPSPEVLDLLQRVTPAVFSHVASR